jgi:hypothetical protein
MPQLGIGIDLLCEQSPQDMPGLVALQIGSTEVALAATMGMSIAMEVGAQSTSIGRRPMNLERSMSA